MVAFTIVVIATVRKLVALAIPEAVSIAAATAMSIASIARTIEIIVECSPSSKHSCSLSARNLGHLLHQHTVENHPPLPHDGNLSLDLHSSQGC